MGFVRTPTDSGDGRCSVGHASYRSFTPRTEGASPSYAAESIPRFPGRVSLVLENSGSVARDHLASERTFLAYVRTSLTIASAAVGVCIIFGIAFEVYARPLAVTTILLALYVLFVGVSRYFSIQSALTKGNFPVTRFRLGIIALVLGGIVTSVFGLLLAERMKSR
ncbi:hypothetical protein C8R43DRAFT_883229 [Mycena crocata]|nr:hypothetical protein C8R43DRAFT_883229 [Mycena crocata]